MIKLNINGIDVEVEEGTTILEAAKKVNIDIPTLCFLKEINEIGDCRMCVVEVEGRRGFATSCIQKAEEGMIVHNDRECLTCVRNRKLRITKTSRGLSE